MGDVIGINAFFRVLPIDQPALRAGDRHVSPLSTPGDGSSGGLDSPDQVEWSAMGSLLSGAAEPVEARHNRIGSIRAAITAGTYETPSKIAVAVDRLLRQLE